MNDRLKSIASFFGGDDEPVDNNNNWGEEEVETWKFSIWNDRVYVNTTMDDGEKLYFCKSDNDGLRLVRKVLGKAYHSTIARKVEFYDEIDDWSEAFEEVYGINLKNEKFDDFYKKIQNNDLRSLK